MKIELKIDNERTELSQKEAVGSVSDVEIYPVPYVFYYTNYLNFKPDDREGGFDCVKFFDNRLGSNIEFGGGGICLSEHLTNMYEAQSFYNRFDLYHITWEIVRPGLLDSIHKQKIIEYLMQNCCLMIYVGGIRIPRPFTDLNNRLYVNIESFVRMEKRETFIIKLKKTGQQPSSDNLKLAETMLKIYLHGNYWLEKRN